MKPKDALEQIETTLEVMKTRDVATVHKLATTLFRPADALTVVDQQLSIDIKTKITEILSSAEPAQTMVKIKETKQSLELIRNKLATPALPKKYLEVANVQRSDDYLKAVKKYSNFVKAIEKLENDIMNSEEYDKKLYEEIKHGKYRGYLHARLTDNLRIMYGYYRKTKTIIFEYIITKNELEKS